MIEPFLREKDEAETSKEELCFCVFRKTITTLAFSPDGKYLVTGESGHMPAVRVWDVSDRLQVSELQEHKFGVACVAFSPNGKYIVSVGFEHDMMVIVWNWKKNVVVATNKVSNKVTAVSFSDDSSYFVTAGNRHVKFWYLDHDKTSKGQSTAALQGRPARLKSLMNNLFCDVACGRGRHASSTFCVTSSGQLCVFNERTLGKWVELQTSRATCLSVTEDFIFCGCSDGTVRVFSPVSLSFLYPLPRPHSLRTDIDKMCDPSQLFSCTAECRYPDTVAVTCDPANHCLSCVYDDHSVYVWDIRDISRPGKLYSALYHSSSVWSLEVYTDGAAEGEKLLPPGSFLSCSADNTIRLWNVDGHAALHRNILSHDLKKIIYVDDDNISSLSDADSITSPLKAGPSEGQQTDPIRTGIRALRVSPDGQHLASGDFEGILRIHDLTNMEEILSFEAHESEILCLEYFKPEKGLQLLATASRDRRIHILDASRDYSLVQTLQDHSSSINAVRFAANEGKLWLISCGADKNICFYTAQKTKEDPLFTLTHSVVSKISLSDMEVDLNRKCAAVGCKDRNIRIFDIRDGKEKKSYKGSRGDDGSIVKVHIDPSGLYIATSCSDKNISIFDFFSGECVATMFGHSEIITGLKFSSDCKYLITVSGDSCIFVWRLSPELTIRMRQRLADLKPRSSVPHRQNAPQQRAAKLSNTNEEEEEEAGQACPYMETAGCAKETETSAQTLNRDGREETSGGRLPQWPRAADDSFMVTSMIDLRLVEEEVKTPPSFNSSQRRRRTVGMEPQLQRNREEMASTLSLKVSSGWVDKNLFLSSQSLDGEEPVLFPDQWEDRVRVERSLFQQKGASPAAGGPKGKPRRPAGDEPLNEEQISFELEEEEDEEEEGRRRRCSDARDVRQTADHTRADPPVSGKRLHGRSRP
uniref:Mitogen-activated protein kinase binding protein 1 n=1 Tax=Oryzias melastigma TaxID=30732 RepID=A0A3B3CLS5_ORYME